MENHSQKNPIDPLKTFLSRWAVRLVVIFLTFGLGILLFISLWTVTTAYKKQTMQNYQAMPLPDGALLDVTYPPFLLVDASSVGVVAGLRLKDTAVFTPPLTITLDIPPSMAISGTVRETWAFTESNQLPVTVFLRNTAVLSQTQRQTITLTLTSTQPISPTFALLGIEVESPTDAARRHFFSGIFNENAPLLLALAVLFPIASLLLQQYQHEQSQRQLTLAERELDLTTLKFDKESDLNAQRHALDVERTARELELEGKRYALETKKIDHDYQQREAMEKRLREQQEREQKEQELKLAPQKISDLRRYLSEGNRRAVQDMWTHITDDVLEHAAAPRERIWLKQLVEFCLTGQVAGIKVSTWIDDVRREFTPELVGAFIAARDEIMASPEIYRPMFRQIPLEKVLNLILRNQFIRLWLEVDQIRLQGWPQEIPPRANILGETPLLQTSLYRTNFLLADPLQYNRAEDEETNLFAREGFWFEHPAYRAVANATQMQAVLGPIGCGRTALAKGLCYNESRWSRYFWHYRTVYSGATTVAALRSDLAEQLLFYVITRPTLLVPIQEHQRLLLAELLIDSLPKKQVLARLERARANEPWLRPATTHEQRTVWRDVGNTELALLIQAVESTTVEPPQAELLWAKMLLESFQALSFYGVRLALDCLTDANETITRLLPTLQEWQQSGLITTLFIPDNTRVNVPSIAKVPLTWSQTQLEALFAYRLLRLADFHLPPNALFSSDSVYNEFMAEAASPPATPRKLAQLWQNALANLGDEEAISQNALRKALTVMQVETQATETAVQEYSLERLEALMDEGFNDEEIRSLCLALSVDYDNLGAGNKRGKIRELVLLMNRTGRLPDLVSKCQAERPSINWA